MTHAFGGATEHIAQVTVSRTRLLQDFPFSRQNIWTQDALCFGVVKEQLLVAPHVCVKPILLFPDTPSTSVCSSAVFSRRVIGDGSLGEVKDAS